MGKKKKGISKKINPEKSNKMIYAVGFGVFILFLVGVNFIINSDKKNAEDPIINIRNILKDSDTILDCKISKNDPHTINVILKEKNKESMKLIKTHGSDLSSRKRNIEFEFIISVGKIENAIYSIKFKAGEITNSRSIAKK